MSLTMPVQFATSGLLGPPLADLVVSLLVYVVLVAVPIGLVAWLASYLLSLPLRRQERARFFLDLLETALQQGQPVEPTLADIANSRDRSMGVRFHLMAAYLERGLRLGQALQKVPRLLPPQVSAMLRTGEHLGDLRKVLPTCRHLLQDAQSSVRGAANYLVVVALVLSPLAIFIFNVLAIYVFPRFSEMTMDMGEARSPVFEFVRTHIGWLMSAQAGLLGLLLLAALLYVGGPRVAGWFRFASVPVVDWVAWRVPWKRKRMQRNFSAMLALLLDAEVPEPEAVKLAAACAANEIFRRRAARVTEALQRGLKLTEAVQVLDDRGEFRWRLTNATHARGGFFRALAGWHEALDAKAFQEEQAAAHVVTSALVVANGLLVALVAVAVFGALASIIQEGVLW